MAGFITKTWADRQSTYPSRRRLTATGTTDIYDVSREEGTITDAGDAFSATNMNDLETRIEDFAEITPSTYVLYSYPSGTQSAIVLSDTSANYTYLEIFFRDTTSIYSSVKVPAPDGKRIGLSIVTQSSVIIYWRSAYVTINGTAVTWTNNRGCKCGTSGGGTEIESGSPIYIHSIIGYK